MCKQKLGELRPPKPPGTWKNSAPVEPRPPPPQGLGPQAPGIFGLNPLNQLVIRYL